MNRTLVLLLALALLPSVRAQSLDPGSPGFGGLAVGAAAGAPPQADADDYFRRLGATATGSTYTPAGGTFGISSPPQRDIEVGQSDPVPPVAHGRTYPWDSRSRTVAIGGSSRTSLFGQTVRCSGKGTFYGHDESSGTVSIRHQTPAGRVYLLAYTPVRIDGGLQHSIGRELTPGTRLGTVQGEYLFLQALVHEQGRWVPSGLAFDVPGVKYPNGTRPGTGSVEF